MNRLSLSACILVVCCFLCIPQTSWAQETMAPEKTEKKPPAAPPKSNQETKSIEAVETPSITTNQSSKTSVEAVKKDGISVEEISRFVGVFRALDEGYVDDVSHTKLMKSAIRGLLLDLDPHSAYLDESDAASLNDLAAGSYGGLGVEVMLIPDRGLLIIAPMDDTPAARAGLLPGDHIVGIDGQPFSVETGQDAINSLRGKPGSKITLSISRDDTPEPFDVELTREKIDVASARVQTLADDFLYIRIASFQADTAKELRRDLKKRQKKHPSPFKGAVLDLRRNPGGLLGAAVEVSDIFLEKGMIVSTRGRLASSNSTYRATPGDALNGAPIVILTDAGTASAAEVLAGALRDHKRALTMGTRSFGKGSVQSVFPLDNGDAIKITTARYYTPNGTSIQAEGIVPDVPIKGHGKWVEDHEPAALREADLPTHLSNERLQVGKITPLNTKDAEDDSYEAPSLTDHEKQTDSEKTADQSEYDPDKTDPLVQEALNLLRGLALFGQKP